MQTVLVVILAAVAGCASIAEANPPVALVAPDGPVALADAVTQGLLTFEARGAGTSSVRLTLHARVDLDVTIAAGTFFEARSHVQNMVVTRSTSVRLRAGATATVELATACASYHRSVPQADHAFVLGAAPPRLQALVSCLEGRRISHGRRQMLVWNVTDGIGIREAAQRPDRLRPYLVASCTQKLGISAERCTTVVDRAFDVALERWLGHGDAEDERACLEASAAAP